MDREVFEISSPNSSASIDDLFETSDHSVQQKGNGKILEISTTSNNGPANLDYSDLEAIQLDHEDVIEEEIPETTKRRGTGRLYTCR